MSGVLLDTETENVQATVCAVVEELWHVKVAAAR